MSASLTPVDLLYGADEETLREVVRALLNAECSPLSTIARMEGPSLFDQSTWRRLAVDVGVASLVVPEDLGGAGATWREVAVVVEELGAVVAPLPVVTTAMATVVLLSVDDADLLAGVCAGEVVVLAVPWAGADASPLAVEYSNGRLRGVVRGVADLGAAEAVLVPAREADGTLVITQLRRDAVGVAVDALSALDQTRPLADLRLDAAEALVLVRGEPAEASLEASLEVGVVLLASEQVGLAQGALDQSLSYVQVRKQYARTIGSFQAIKHRFADLWTELAAARAVARYAASCLATQHPDTKIATAMAGSVTSEVGLSIAENMIQFHGGIGFTWEHPAHLYVKRARTSKIALGSPVEHRRILSDLVGVSRPYL